MRFAVKIEETIGKTIIVEATSLIKAIKMVENAANNDVILLDGIEDFVGREVKPSDAFEGGIVPENKDVSFYEHLKHHIVKATFISYWDGGIEVTTPCKVNLNTREIFDIQKSNTEGLEVLEGEQVDIDNILYEAFPKDEADDGDYWYES